MAEDYGLFGPGSVTWRVMGEPVQVIGGFRALALQALHPPTMWGVAQNSALMDPRTAGARIRRTFEFVRVRTYGTREEVERAAGRVRRTHARLTAFHPHTGEIFRIDDPENLLWAHMGEVDSYLDVAMRAGVPLTPEDADAFVDEQRRSGAVMGLDPADIPASVAEMRAYYEEMRPRLYACPPAKRIVRRLFKPAVPRRLLPLKLAAPTVTALVIATLPRWARRMYGLPATPLEDLWATTTLKALHQGTRLLPERLRYAPDARRARRLTRAPDLTVAS